MPGDEIEALRQVIEERGKLLVEMQRAIWWLKVATGFLLMSIALALVVVVWKI